MAAARKCVGGAENYRGAFFFQAAGEFADGRGFAGAVDADDEDDARFVGRFAVGIGIPVCSGCGEDFQDLIFQFALQRAGFGEFVLVHLLAEGGEDFFGGAHAEVGAEQRGFELLQQLGVNGAIAGEELFDARGKFRASFADGIFQPFEECGFGWSEERDHDLPQWCAEHLIVAKRLSLVKKRWLVISDERLESLRDRGYW